MLGARMRPSALGAREANCDRGARTPPLGRIDRLVERRAGRAAAWLVAVVLRGLGLVVHVQPRPHTEAASGASTVWRSPSVRMTASAVPSGSTA